MAAGRGTRVGEKVPKQFLLLRNKALFLYSLEAFEKAPSIHGYILMVPEEYVNETKGMVKQFRKLKDVIVGGKSRHETSLIAIKKLERFTPEIVVFHDAARPFLKIQLVEQVIRTAKEYGASTAAARVSDTVAYCEGNFVKSYISRENLYRILTPQAFKYDLAVKVFEAEEGDDGTSLFVKAGLKVAIVLSDQMNFKITFPEDYQLAQLIADFWNSYI